VTQFGLQVPDELRVERVRLLEDEPLELDLMLQRKRVQEDQLVYFNARELHFYLY